MPQSKLLRKPHERPSAGDIDHCFHCGSGDEEDKICPVRTKEALRHQEQFLKQKRIALGVKKKLSSEEWEAVVSMISSKEMR